MSEALGEPDAYASAGVEDALVILSGYTARLGIPPTDVHLSDRPEVGVLRLGDPGARALGQLRTSTPGLFRVVAHRRPERAVDELVGVTIADLRVFSRPGWSAATPRAGPQPDREGGDHHELFVGRNGQLF